MRRTAEGGGRDQLAWLPFEVFAHVLSEAQHGSPDALERFCTGVYPLVREFVRWYVPMPNAEDVTQEVMIRLVRAHRRIAPYDCGRFIVAVARNEVLRERRKLTRPPARTRDLAVRLDSVPDPGMPPTALDDVEYSNLWHAVRNACLRLPSGRLREIALAVFVEGLDPVTVARHLGVADGTARVRLHRARELLRLDPELRRWRPRATDGDYDPMSHVVDRAVHTTHGDSAPVSHGSTRDDQRAAGSARPRGRSSRGVRRRRGP